MAKYRLIVTIAGPNYSDSVVLEDDLMSNLVPGYITYENYLYERYSGDVEGEYVEFRADYVVARKLEMVEPDPPQEEEENDG